MSEIKQHKHIVISGDTGNALGVIRALGEEKISPILIYLNEPSHLPTLIKSKYLKQVFVVDTGEDALEVLIKNYWGEVNKPFIYTCDDTIQSIIDEKYEELCQKFYFFNSGCAGRINKLMDKHTICMIAQKCGCNIPKLEVVDTGILPRSIQYPIMTKTLKSTMGLWKEDSYICHNEEELKNAYVQIQSPKLLVEEYIEKQNEISLMGFSCNNGNDVYIPYTISFIRYSNRAYGHYMYVKPFTDEQLREKVYSIIKECQYEGCFEVEFLVDKNDKLWFLEVNFRYSFWNYALTYGGINYPLSWAQSILDGKIDIDKYKSNLKDYFIALNEPGDFGQSVVTKKISVFQWIKDIHNADMLYFYNPKDPLPAWSFWWHKFIRMFKKKIRRR